MVFNKEKFPLAKLYSKEAAPPPRKRLVSSVPASPIKAQNYLKIPQEECERLQARRSKQLIKKIENQVFKTQTKMFKVF